MLLSILFFTSYSRLFPSWFSSYILASFYLVFALFSFFHLVFSIIFQIFTSCVPPYFLSFSHLGFCLDFSLFPILFFAYFFQVFPCSLALFSHFFPICIIALFSRLSPSFFRLILSLSAHRFRLTFPLFSHFVPWPFPSSFPSFSHSFIAPSSSRERTFKSNRSAEFMVAAESSFSRPRLN